jgi:hypothetical protein
MEQILLKIEMERPYLCKYKSWTNRHTLTQNLAWTNDESCLGKMVDDSGLGKMVVLSLVGIELAREKEGPVLFSIISPTWVQR